MRIVRALVVLMGLMLTTCVQDPFMQERPPIVYAADSCVLVSTRGAPTTLPSTALSSPRDGGWAMESADWYPDGGKIQSKWKWIVIHHSATSSGGAVRFDKAHRRRGWDGLGYHFVIGNGTDTADGQIEVGKRWHGQEHGAHCKTPDNYYNDHGIGICLVGHFDQEKPSAAQLRSLDSLLRFLCRECHISPKRVTTHQDVTHKTRCPGKYFPIDSIRQSLSNRR